MSIHFVLVLEVLDQGETEGMGAGFAASDYKGFFDSKNSSVFKQVGM